MICIFNTEKSLSIPITTDSYYTFDYILVFCIKAHYYLVSSGNCNSVFIYYTCKYSIRHCFKSNYPNNTQCLRSLREALL